LHQRQTGEQLSIGAGSIVARSTLQGSIANLGPAAAFQAVLATTDLSVEERPNGTMVIAKT
jgi:hypothetical protein